MRYHVTVNGPDGTFLCGATLSCRDQRLAEQRFLELPLPIGEADLKAGRRVIARRVVGSAPPLKDTGW